ncbi:hypothetical protein [Psychrobacter pygoscelis]|uniref:hypothetical protein n=1 Tax=Psychrobacter pygoscelis TaxID=2488563 RepID=UPI001040020B|nr:hypothetical protein [Psychrobacter pygoscelis]
MKPSIKPAHSLLFPILPAALCSVLALSACQKPQDNEVDAQTETVPVETTSVETTPVDETAQIDQSEPDASVSNDEAANQVESDTTQVQTAPSDTQVISNEDLATTATPEINDYAKEAQITDVDYRSAAGEQLKVTFQTSAINELQANVLLPSGKRVMLTAPEGQGNNPTYRSTDGTIELVSHGGGGSIDLLQNGKLTSYDAASVDAEVVTSK